MTQKTSRDTKLLDPEFFKRVTASFADFKRLYPMKPQPFITDVYRDKADQERAFTNKKSNAHFGESLHNYIPSYACDVAFLRSDKTATWDIPLYDLFIPLALSYGLKSGKDFPSLKDYPHIEAPITVKEIKLGKTPSYPMKKDYSQIGKDAEQLYRGGIISGAELVLFLSVLIELQ